MMSEVCWVEFGLDESLIFNILKLSLEGERNFGLDFSKFDLVISKKEFCLRFCSSFLRLVDLGKVEKFVFKDLEFEIFKKYILRSHLRNKYFKNFELVGKKREDFCELNFNVEKSLEVLNGFSNEVIVDKGEQVLSLCSRIFNKSNFVFVDSFGGVSSEGAQERFVCYLFNDDLSFEKILEFLKKEFGEKFCLEFLDFLRLSQQIVLSFSLMRNGDLRRTIYFNVDQFERKDLKECFNLCGLDFSKFESVWGVGIDFVRDLKKVKVYCERESVGRVDFEEFLNGVRVEKFWKVLEGFKAEKLAGVLFDEKFVEGKIFSKRVDISLSMNEFDVDSFCSVLGLEKEFFEGKFFYTLSFEFYMDCLEKFNFYFSFK